MNKTIKMAGLLSLALGFLLMGVVAQAQVPQLINYQGVLKDSGGNPITGSEDIVFSIYDAASGGNLLWQESHGGVNVENGLFNVLLGSTAFPDNFFSGSDLYLGVKVGNDPEMTPRQQLASVSDALKAKDADSLGDGLVTADTQSQSVVFGAQGTGAETSFQRAFTTPASTNLVTNYTTFGDVARLTARRANGTIATPGAILAGDGIGNIQFRGYDGSEYSTGTAGITAVATENYTATTQGTKLFFVSTPNGSATPRIRLLVASDGNVGIGTQSPTEKLQVVGNVRANAFLNTSTRALKKDIVPLAQGDYQKILKQIDSLQLFHYLYKTESNRQPHLGVIAEESPKQILDPSGKAVSLYDYVSFLMAGLKAQTEEINELKAQTQEITQLKDKLNKLEAELAAKQSPQGNNIATAYHYHY